LNLLNAKRPDLAAVAAKAVILAGITAKDAADARHCVGLLNCRPQSALLARSSRVDVTGAIGDCVITIVRGVTVKRIPGAARRNAALSANFARELSMA
jgi:hypothetical protein